MGGDGWKGLEGKGMDGRGQLTTQIGASDSVCVC